LQHRIASELRAQECMVTAKTTKTKREREIKKLLLMLMEERRRGEGKLKTNCELIEKFKTNHGSLGARERNVKCEREEAGKLSNLSESFSAVLP
jgi:hypothetical protein